MPSISKMMGFGLAPQVAGAVTGDISITLTATGSTQATALALSANHNLLTTVAAATGVVLPAVSSPPGLGVSNGDQITVYNNGANTVNVYPPLGSTIGLAAVSFSSRSTALAMPCPKWPSSRSPPSSSSQSRLIKMRLVLERVTITA